MLFITCYVNQKAAEKYYNLTLNCGGLRVPHIQISFQEHNNNYNLRFTTLLLACNCNNLLYTKKSIKEDY